MLFISVESFGDFTAYDFCRETKNDGGLSFCLGVARLLKGTLLFECGSGSADFCRKVTLGVGANGIKRESEALFPAETKRLVCDFWTTGFPCRVFYAAHIKKSRKISFTALSHKYSGIIKRKLLRLLRPTACIRILYS